MSSHLSSPLSNHFLVVQGVNLVILMKEILLGERKKKNEKLRNYLKGQGKETFRMRMRIHKLEIEYLTKKLWEEIKCKC